MNNVPDIYNRKFLIYNQTIVKSFPNNKEIQESMF